MDIVRDHFGSTTRPPSARAGAPQFVKDSEGFLRQGLILELDDAISSLEMAPYSDFARGKAIRTLKQLLSALKDGPEKFVFSYEPAVALFPEHRKDDFHEGLVRLRDRKDRIIKPAQIFGALAFPANKPDLDIRFRQWLAFAHIDTFYSNNAPEEGLSLNFVPEDIDDESFRGTLKDALISLRNAGYGNITIEAVETGPWTGARMDFLKKLRAENIKVALDDYGAPDGKHTAETLAALAAGPGKPVMVKMDGVIVESFLAGTDNALIDRLREVQAHAPDALVVAERLSNVEDVRALIAKLRPHGLENSIHMGQDYRLKDSTAVIIPSGPDAGTPAPKP